MSEPYFLQLEFARYRVLLKTASRAIERMVADRRYEDLEDYLRPLVFDSKRQPVQRHRLIEREPEYDG